MKKKNDDFEFIKNKFDSDGIEAPPALSESEIRGKIEAGAEHKAIRLKKKTPVRAIASCAACFILAVAVFAAGSFPKISKSEKTDVNGVSSFESYDEIEDYIKKLRKGQHISYYSKSFAVEESADAAAPDASAGGSSHSETYKQVDAVDEADIIKTDGEYIYYARPDKIYIYKANGSEPYRAAVIEPENISDSYISEMFLHGSRLFVNMNRCDDSKSSEYFSDSTVTAVYDISEPESPALVNEFIQSGSYVSSRMLGDMLYIVSQEYLYDETKAVPYTEENGKCEPVDCGSIYYAGKPSDASYVIISAINTQGSDRFSDTVAVLGGSENIYCNEKNMYITSFDSGFSVDSTLKDDAEASENAGGKTHIIKLSLDGTEIKVAAAGAVEGYTNNQFSMDEYGGNLRIAVTGSDVMNGETENSLYVLDGSLNEIGRITGLAEGESIKAVRFSENIAYVITYEQTDPLFVIDLSEPSNPVLLGSVEITGFSSMLIPLEGGRVLGIGYETSQGELGVIRSGIKLVLFDVSNPESPSILSTKVFDGADSDAQFTHKALVVNREENYYAIPFNRYNYSLLQNNSGIITFSVENDEITVSEIFTNPADYSNYSYSSRCVYAGGCLYSLTDTPEIFAYKY